MAIPASLSMGADMAPFSFLFARHLDLSPIPASPIVTSH